MNVPHVTALRPRRALAGGLCLLALGASASAQSNGPIRDALQTVDAEVVTYNDHLTILASPWMEGRLPGTRGMELAKEYMEYHFRQYGLRAPYDGEVEQSDGTTMMEANASYRQPFELGQSAEIERGDLTLMVGDESHQFTRGRNEDFTVTGLGEGGEVKGDLVYLGYAIDAPEHAYTSFSEDQSIEGKIAVVLRFEPFEESGENEGKSLWKGERRTGWSQYAGFAHKIEQLSKRGAAGVIIINTPGVADRRANRLYTLSGVGLPKPFEGPVLHMSTEAGRHLVAKASGGSTTLEELVAAANEGGDSANLGGTLDVGVVIDRNPLTAENIVAVLPGKGTLAEEKVVVGAHLDHLGMGDFGSRDREAGVKLHPGADDNATGCAGILLIAQKMARDYAAAGDDANLRTIVFIAFSAEESGLNGAEHYAENPLGSLGSHKLMMNFDMIGRMTDSRVKLSGTWTGDGLGQWLQPIIAASPLNVVEERVAGGGSDHQEFYQRRVPVLFSIIADIHNDYHTSRDISSLINRVEAVHAANLFYEIASAYAKLPTPFEYVGRREVRRMIQDAEKEAKNSEAGEPATGPVQASVRLGIVPAYNADDPDREPGITVGRVPADGPADKAGLKGGDRIITWGGDEIDGPSELGDVLRKAKAGDKVELGVVRDGETLTLTVTLEAR